MASCSEHPPEALTLSSVVVTKITFWAVVRGAKLSIPSRIVATANHRPERDRAGGFIGQQGIIRDILVLLDARVPWPREACTGNGESSLASCAIRSNLQRKDPNQRMLLGNAFYPQIFFAPKSAARPVAHKSKVLGSGTLGTVTTGAERSWSLAPFRMKLPGASGPPLRFSTSMAPLAISSE